MQQLQQRQLQQGLNLGRGPVMPHGERRRLSGRTGGGEGQDWGGNSGAGGIDAAEAALTALVIKQGSVQGLLVEVRP